MKTLHQNNFGALRLFFAALVILAHSPELIDGNRSRELLNQMVGNMTFGEVGVDSFFLISGYLITKSFYSSLSLKHFLIKRILRIYPAFVVASLFCIFVIAPLSGGWQLISNFNLVDWLKIPSKIILLYQPWVEGAFAGLKDNKLNGAMWSIPIEFACYLTVPILHFTGLAKKKYFPWTLLFFTGLLLLFKTKSNSLNDLLPPYISMLAPYSTVRFFTAFLVGASFYHYQHLIKWSWATSIICIILLVVCMQSGIFAEIGLIVFGSYLLFNFALNFKQPFLNSIGSKNDISYGVYLYAWPFQNLIIQYFPNISPWSLTLCALVLAVSMGYISWMLVEKPFMQMKLKLKSE